MASALETQSKINDAEREAINARRAFYDVLRDQPFATGLAISGGGIRSATFGLGVLAALARRGVLPQIDYLSTVSGGGYLGSFLSAFLSSPPKDPDQIGLCPEQIPFKKDDGEAAALRHVRHHSRYLAVGTLWDKTTTIIGQLFGMVVNILAVAYVAAVVAFIELVIRSAGASNDLVRQWLGPALIFLGAGGIATLLVQRFSRTGRDRANRWVAVPAVIVAVMLVWMGLGAAHEWFTGAWANGWKGFERQGDDDCARRYSSFLTVPDCRGKTHLEARGPDPDEGDRIAGRAAVLRRSISGPVSSYCRRRRCSL